MKQPIYIGIDISKINFHYTLLQNGLELESGEIDNEKKSITKWLSNLKKTYKINHQTSIFCLEHTGPYQNVLVSLINKKNYQVSLESALRIKRSLGLVRGKSDKIDSFRIADYAYRNNDKLLFWTEPREIIQHLKMLSALRIRLMKAILLLEVPVKEIEEIQIMTLNSKSLTNYSMPAISTLREELKTINEKMIQLIISDDRLNRLYQILMSVKGIGSVLARELLIITNEFKNFSTANKFACYIGIAPFENTSGTSLRTKNKISKIGNKRIKSLFHMPVLAVIKAKGELHDYYLKKVAEGHSTKSVRNAIKNKLVHRIFACVFQNRLYN